MICLFNRVVILDIEIAMVSGKNIRLYFKAPLKLIDNWGR